MGMKRKARPEAWKHAHEDELAVAEAEVEVCHLDEARA